MDFLSYIFYRSIANMCYKIILGFLFVFPISGCSFAEQTGKYVKLEQSVCGLKEPFIFWLWSNTAGRPSQKRLVGLSNVKDISFKAKDNRILRGYLLQANEDRQELVKKPKGFLLVLQGNAILADQILTEFSRFSRAGYDVYIYDYRGYGRSEGKRRLKAMVSDINEIVLYLTSKPYDERLVYAMSFGGILLLDSFDVNRKLDRVIIDSTPSRLSTYGCPQEFDPILRLPKDCSNFMFITGKRDHVVTAAMSQEMVKLAQQRNAMVVSDAEFSHPFMDASRIVHQRRMHMIERFLLGHND